MLVANEYTSILVTAVDTLLDVRHAFRSLLRHPLYAAVAVVTLALGIGSITLLFAVIDAVLLQPIGQDDGRLVRIWKNDVQRNSGLLYPVSHPEYVIWQEESRSFEALASINYADGGNVALLVEGEPVPAKQLVASAELLSVLGMEPLLGRTLSPDDDVRGAELVAVASHGFWQRVAGGDPALVGRRLTYSDGGGVVVVGVAPPDFDYPLGTDLWVPIVPTYERAEDSLFGNERFSLERPEFQQFHVVGLLAPGVTIGEAEAEITLIHERLAADYPDDYRQMEIVVSPLADTILGGTRPTLLLLLGGAGLVFLIAGVNVATLVLMRTELRRKELDVRVALGASPSRLLRHTMTEALILGVGGATGGLALTEVLSGLTRSLDPATIPRIDQVAVNPTVLGFCLLAVAASVGVLGTVPIWGRRTARDNLTSGLGERTGLPPAFGKQLRFMTAAEISIAAVVVVSAGLLAQSLVNLQSIDRGFEDSGVVVANILLPGSRYATIDNRRAFYERLVERVEQIPGVTSAAPFHIPPGSATTGLSSPMEFEGQTPDEASRNQWANWDIATPSYFQTMGIPIVQGRAFATSDTADSQLVSIVSESTAERYWPGEAAIGKQVRISAAFEWTTVVGVARDLRYRELTNHWLTIYYPAAQSFFFNPGYLAVRASGEPMALSTPIQRAIQMAEPSVPQQGLTPITMWTKAELDRPRLAVWISGGFGLVALVLAAVGVFGTVSFETAQQRVELAIRSALGASPEALTRRVVGRGVCVAAVGVGSGLMICLGGARLLAASLFGIQATDPTTLLAVAVGLLLLVAMTCLPAARRAARTDPAEVLRRS